MAKPALTGDQIREARRSAGLTQPEFSQWVGVSARTIGIMESCGSLPVSCNAATHRGLDRAMRRAQRRAEQIRQNGEPTNGQAPSPANAA